MKIGVSIQNYGKNPSRDFLKKIPLEIENRGLDSIWTSDHIIVRQNDKPWTRVFETLTTLSFFASITEKVFLGTSILLAALRDPLVVGKQIATLDSLSGGRVMIGVGVGWNEPEFNMLGKDFVSRATNTEGSIKQWKKLWTGGFSEEGFVSEPLPSQRGGPPILIGGQSNRAIKRVTSVGDGWQPVGIGVEQYQKGIDQITNLRKDDYIWSLRIGFVANKDLNPHYVGTDGAPRVRLVGSTNKIIDEIEKYRNIGLEHLVCDIKEDSHERYLDQIKILSEIKRTL